ncbi:unnamed protein product, partial [Didymodactylos carnosus]
MASVSKTNMNVKYKENMLDLVKTLIEYMELEHISLTVELNNTLPVYLWNKMDHICFIINQKFNTNYKAQELSFVLSLLQNPLLAKLNSNTDVQETLENYSSNPNNILLNGRCNKYNYIHLTPFQD